MFYENEGRGKKSYLFLSGTDIEATKIRKSFSIVAGVRIFCFNDKLKKIFA